MDFLVTKIVENYILFMRTGQEATSGGALGTSEDVIMYVHKCVQMLLYQYPFVRRQDSFLSQSW